MTHEEDLRRLLNDAATDIPAGNAPIAELVREGRRSKNRRHIVQAASVAAAMAVIAVGAFIVGPSIGGSGNLATQPTTSPSGLAVPPGTRLVGMNGVAVAVPEDWGTNQTDDEKCDVPLENTVVFKKPAIESLMSNWCLSLRERWSSLHWFPADDEQIAEAITDYEPADDIGGVAVFRNGTGPRMCAQTDPGGEARCLPNQLNGALIVPSENVLMYVNSPRKATIEKVLGSVRLIPEGYTAVPDLSGLTSDTEVQPLVENAGLLWEHRCPDGHTCRMLPIEATDPAAGSVVPLGTAVRVVDEPDRKSDTTDDDRSPAPVGEIPGESDLLGRWRAVGEPARQLKSAGFQETSLVLDFSQSGQKFWWGGSEICNGTAGRFKVGADGAFSTSHVASTGIGCGEDSSVVTVPEVVVEATQVRLVAGQLRLFDEGNSLLATFERVEATPAPTTATDNASELTSCSGVVLPPTGVGKVNFRVDRAKGILEFSYSERTKNYSYTIAYNDDPTCRANPATNELIERALRPHTSPTPAPYTPTEADVWTQQLVRIMRELGFKDPSGDHEIAGAMLGERYEGDYVFMRMSGNSGYAFDGPTLGNRTISGQDVEVIGHRIYGKVLSFACRSMYYEVIFLVPEGNGWVQGSGHVRGSQKLTAELIAKRC